MISSLDAIFYLLFLTCSMTGTTLVPFLKFRWVHAYTHILKYIYVFRPEFRAASYIRSLFVQKAASRCCPLSLLSLDFSVGTIILLHPTRSCHPYIRMYVPQRCRSKVSAGASGDKARGVCAVVAASRSPRVRRCGAVAPARRRRR